MVILKASNIDKIYGGYKEHSLLKAVNAITLDIEKGEFTSVMGPSGSGKTTLLNILSGLDRPTSGSVLINDTPIWDLNKESLARFRRSHLGFIFQNFNLLESLTLEENIMLPMVLEKRQVNEMQQKATELMKLFSIDSISNKYPYNVSGGQQQKAAICRALINDTSIIFADEPTGNLDSKSTKTVMQSFEHINKTHGTTLLMVTHDPLAASYSNRVIFIKDGRIRTEIYKKDTQKNFFQKIMDNLSALEGDDCEL